MDIPFITCVLILWYEDCTTLKRYPSYVKAFQKGKEMIKDIVDRSNEDMDKQLQSLSIPIHIRKSESRIHISNSYLFSKSDMYRIEELDNIITVRYTQVQGIHAFAMVCPEFSIDQVGFRDIHIINI